MIQESDIVIANINSFRGKEADSGTVWECGYASALGKDVYGYLHSTRAYIENFSKDEKILDDGYFVDTKKRIIEDFDYPVNLMIACSIKDIIAGEFEDVLKVLTN